MTIILSTINAAILLIISLLHFYWGFGGRWGLAQSLPTNEQGETVLKPDAVACFVVAIGLMCMSMYVFGFSKMINLPLPNLVSKYGIWVIAFIFLARAIGDFKYVGFGKKIKTTRFAELDTRYYAPLCLYLGLTSVLIALIV
jgi:fatty acid desaturase